MRGRKRGERGEREILDDLRDIDGSSFHLYLFLKTGAEMDGVIRCCFYCVISTINIRISMILFYRASDEGKNVSTCTRDIQSASRVSS